MTDKEYMEFAISLAKKTVGQTSPNPSVGAVVVKDGRIIGIGTHLKAGEPHAEVHALQMAGEEAEGATIYVTLEPCSHFGKTPPCANLIIEKKLKRCVVATVDPNPVVSGNGVKRLKEAGIEVLVGVMQQEADNLNPFFNYFMKKQQPYITLKAATSLDGKIATVTGDSKWITGPKAREDVHRLRHQHDAILVGIGTVLADNPSLTTRLDNGGINPLRIILDTDLKTPLTANLVNDQQASTWIICGQNASKEKQMKLEQKDGVSVYRLTTNRVEIGALLQLLREHKVLSLLVEGGSKVNASFLEADAFNQVISYIAPKLIGGDQAPSSIAGKGIGYMRDVKSLSVESVELIGDDIKIVSRRKEDE